MLDSQINFYIKLPLSGKFIYPFLHCWGNVELLLKEYKVCVMEEE